MATPVAAGNQTVAFIRSLVRELCACPAEQQLSTSYIDTTLNNFYASDFPYAIKIDQMRNVYTFFTQPYQSYYPLDVNFNQGVRSPVYIDGVQGTFYKDRQDFFALWPKWPTFFNNFGPVSNAMPTVFSFTVPGPFLQFEVTVGGVDVNGNAFSISDDGKGNLQLQTPNPQVSVPVQTTNPALPGMYNRNTGNPGLLNPTNIGSVNYVSGQFSFTLPLALQAGTTLQVRVSQYATGRPYSLLFWNNFFIVRPTPKHIHKIEVETYLTPVQFMMSSDSPILLQWAQYLGYGVACEILRRRQDTGGLANLMEGFKRQEAMVLERQGTEEINQRNSNLFSQSTPNQGWNNGLYSGWNY